MTRQRAAWLILAGAALGLAIGTAPSAPAVPPSVIVETSAPAPLLAADWRATVDECGEELAPFDPGACETAAMRARGWLFTPERTWIPAPIFEDDCRLPGREACDGNDDTTPLPSGFTLGKGTI